MKIYTVFLLAILFQSCATSKHAEFWVSGIKIECAAGAGEMKCLQVYKGEDPDNAKWENFYTPIEGFRFEAGTMKKLEVKTDKIEDPPADGSAVRYTMVKEQERRADPRAKVGGAWILSTLADRPIDRSIHLPELNIILDQMQAGGTGGCNNYSGDIVKLNSDAIEFGNIISTKRACISGNIEQEYFNALNSVLKYQTKEEQLIFYDMDGNIKLSYVKKTAPKSDARIHDIWMAIRISGAPINRMSPAPRLEINLTEMKIFGNDGCNEYTGAIKEVFESEIEFGQMASTKKMCRKMETADNFNQAMTKVRGYRLDGLNLILTDEEGGEVLAFLKGD